jgi:hypothetical protein
MQCAEPAGDEGRGGAGVAQSQRAIRVCRGRPINSITVFLEREEDPLVSLRCDVG